MTSDFVKHRLQQKVALYPVGDSSDPVLALCREFAQEAFIAGISMAFQEWIRNRVTPAQQGATRRYLAGRVPALIFSQYLPAMKILDEVELADQLQKWEAKNPTWKSEVEAAAFDPLQLCELANRLYYSLLEFSRRQRN